MGDNFLLLDHSLLWLVFMVILGASLGSFCMSITTRFCNKKSLFTMRSYCFSCGNRLKILELIPIFSYLFLKTKCKTCKATIPFHNFLAEILGIFFIFIAYYLSQNFLNFMLWIVLLFNFFILSYIDFKFKAVPQILLWINFFVCLILAFNNEEIFYFLIFEEFKNGFLSQAFIFAGFLFLLKNLIAFAKNFKTRKIQENLGDADIIILSGMAGIFGFKITFMILFIASLLSLPFFIYKKEIRLAFLPFINVAFVGYLIYLIFGI